jgi:hypothetical protein
MSSHRAVKSQKSNTKTLYDRDFFEWTQRTAALMRAGRWEDLDVENIAEELESLGKRDRREVVSRLEVLIIRMLKWATQPENQCRSWKTTINTQRDDLEDVLNDSPSLRAQLDELLKRAYPRAVEKAVEELRLLTNTFPPECPYTRDEILSKTYWPKWRPK